VEKNRIGPQGFNRKPELRGSKGLLIIAYSDI